jgi:hypothetical protein
MIFSAEFQCYIGNQTLASWPTALGPDAAAQGVRPLTPRRTALGLGHAQGPLLAAPSAVAYGVVPDTVGHSAICIILQNFRRNIYFCKIAIK